MRTIQSSLLRSSLAKRAMPPKTTCRTAVSRYRWREVTGPCKTRASGCCANRRRIVTIAHENVIHIQILGNRVGVRFLRCECLRVGQRSHERVRELPRNAAWPRDSQARRMHKAPRSLQVRQLQCECCSTYCCPPELSGCRFPTLDSHSPTFVTHDTPTPLE